MRQRGIVALVAACAACGNLLAASDVDSVPTTQQGDAGADGAGGPPPPEGETTVSVEPKVFDDGGVGGPTVEGGVVEASTKCAATRGPAMVELAMGAITYCIDATEVTNAQYAAFLAANDKPPQHARCTWNTNFAPNCNNQNTTQPNEPVDCIDWCDAWAFCKWSGKRLCGKIGGGENTHPDANNATKSQWFAACSKGGTQTFCYGKTAMDVCQANGEPVAAVMSNAGCAGPFDGLYDLTGNVGEWEDSCTLAARPEDDNCLRRGGDIGDPYDFQYCNQGYGLGRAARETSGGFRCCRD